MTDPAIPTDLPDLPDPFASPDAVASAADAATVARLRARLGEAAAASGDLDVALRTVDSPVGTLLIAATPAGLVRVAFASEDHDAVLEWLAATVSPRLLTAPGVADARTGGAARQLDEYFAGTRRAFAVPLDRQLSRGFRLQVLQHLDALAFGATETYRDVANALGNPGAVRAVGSACATNPIPIVVPCHRILRTDGSLGGYLGGLDAKRALLALEAA
jgi:methylated-DNA-[protein]-cysteine S-methyltransferase